MKKLCLAWILLLAAPVVACSSDDKKADAMPGSHVDAMPGAIDGAPGPDADYGGWLVLNQGSWSMAPGNDRYYCIIQTIQEDTYIKAFMGMIPTGTHHTVLTIYDGSDPDGITECGPGTNGPTMIYGTGVGTPPLTFPAGVAVKLTKGQRIINNVHLFNAGDATITGTSGTLYKPAVPAEVEHLAELVLAGPVGFQVPQGASTQTGSCSVSSMTTVPIQVFEVAPHMHQLGVHMKSTVIRGPQKIVLQDTDYNFDNQIFELKDPFVELQPGDVVQTECTYQNTTGHAVSFGNKSTDEMCFTNLFYFPKQDTGSSFICAF